MPFVAAHVGILCSAICQPSICSKAYCRLMLLFFADFNASSRTLSCLCCSMNSNVSCIFLRIYGITLYFRALHCALVLKLKCHHSEFRT